MGLGSRDQDSTHDGTKDKVFSFHEVWDDQK
jgi:hypothetical protein